MNRPTDRRTRSAQLGQRNGDVRGFQIGPRIRVGGTLGKVGQAVKIGVGKVASNPIVDSALGFIPGVGPGIAAAANAAGHILDTSNGGIHTAGDVGKVALGAGEAYAGAKLANGIRDNGVMGTIKKVGASVLGRASSGSPAPTQYDANGDPIPPASPAVPSSSPSIMQTVGSGVQNALFPKNPDGSIDYGSLARKAVELGAGYEGYTANQKANDLQNKALDAASQNYTANAPLRDKSRAAILAGPVRNDYSSIFDTGNPYARKRTLPVVGSGAGG